METIQIERVINKVSKANRAYKVFETSAGLVSAFDTHITDALEKAVGQSLDVEIVERNGFLNITNVKPASQQALPVQAEKLEPATTLKDVADGKPVPQMGLYCPACQTLLMKIMSR